MTSNVLIDSAGDKDIVGVMEEFHDDTSTFCGLKEAAVETRDKDMSLRLTKGSDIAFRCSEGVIDIDRWGA